MKEFHDKRSCIFLAFSAILGITLFYLMQTDKWTYPTVLPNIPMPIAQNEASSINAKGYKHAGEVADTETVDEGQWEIIYDEKKLRAEVNSIHDSNYKIKDGDNCTKSIPDCIIVGVGKCGTRELTDFMSIHPNIISKHANGKYHLGKTAFAEVDSTAYLKIKNQMPCQYHDQISVVKADAFLGIESKPKEIFRFNPNMKIIAIIREPVSRIISLLSFQPSKIPGKRGIQDSASMNSWFNQTVQNLEVSQPAMVKASAYDEGLERYLEIFNRDNILVIESNEFKTDPTSVIRRIEVFLGIPNFVSNEYFAFNPEKRFYCIRKMKSASKSMVCYQSNRGRKTPVKVDEEYMEAMRNYFRPHNENLYRLIGRRYDW